MANVPFKIYAEQNNDSDTDITLDQIQWWEKKFYYDPQDDMMVSTLKTAS
jgi:hypothetical protein